MEMLIGKEGWSQNQTKSSGRHWFRTGPIGTVGVPLLNHLCALVGQWRIRLYLALGSILAVDLRPECKFPIFICIACRQEKPCFHLYAANVLGGCDACPSLSRGQIHALFIRRTATNDVFVSPFRHRSIFENSTAMHQMDEISMFAIRTIETIRYNTWQ